MDKLRYVCAQPAIIFYHWQLNVMLHSFKKHGVSMNNVHCVLAIDDTYNPELWNWLYDKYPEVVFDMYEDTRIDTMYVSSIRPHILHKHFERHPALYEGSILYHDCDIVLTRPAELESLLDNDTWYLGDTISYIGSKYIRSKGHNLLQEMCDLVGIDIEVVKKNEQNSGGAQYLMKDVPRNYWYDVEIDCIKLYNYFLYKQWEYRHGYHPIQMWTADMWAVLWNIWKNGISTEISELLGFSWATDDISRWYDTSIYHNAGVTGPGGGMFYKAEYTHMPPVGLVQEDFNPDKCSYNYVKEIIECMGNN